MAEGDWYWRALEGRWRVFPQAEGSTWNDRFPPTDHVLLQEVRDELDAQRVPDGVALVNLEVIARCDDCHDVLTEAVICIGTVVATAQRGLGPRRRRQ